MKNMLLEVSDLAAVADLFKTIIQTIVAPILSIVGVIGVIYAIKLGIDYAKAEDADARKKVQGRLIGACVGVVIIIAGIVLCFAINWAGIYESFKTSVNSSITALLCR